MCVCATVNKSNFHRSPSTTMSIGDDVVVVGSVKKSKKRKDKSAKVDAEQAQQATPLLKAMKKRKREENGEGEGEERKKKKKRKEAADVPNVEEPTPTVVEEKVAKQQSALGIDERAEQRKKKELRKESKKQQKALAKARAASSSTDPAASSKPTPPIKNNTINTEKYLSENAITIHGDIVPVLDFDQLDIQPKLREVLNKFSTPTPIQACAWPALLEGRDVIGIAETGRFVPNP